MATSQNGWPASPNKESIDIGTPKVPDTDVDFPQGVKNGDVTTVLMYVASQFHHNVEPLHDGWCWGYFYRVIEGSSTLSNHSSGTAIDLNAPDHPMGRRGTFSSAQVMQIRRILKTCGGVVRWGGDYSSRPDEMHFEIVGTPQAVSRLAVTLRSLVPPTPPTTHLVQKGDTGTEVEHYQHFLRETFPAYRTEVTVKQGELITVDGDFGDQTEAWVKEFQKRTSLDQDGIIGPLTHQKMKEYGYQY